MHFILRSVSAWHPLFEQLAQDSNIVAVCAAAFIIDEPPAPVFCVQRHHGGEHLASSQIVRGFFFWFFFGFFLTLMDLNPATGGHRLKGHEVRHRATWTEMSCVLPRLYASTHKKTAVSKGFFFSLLLFCFGTKTPKAARAHALRCSSDMAAKKMRKMCFFLVVLKQ